MSSISKISRRNAAATVAAAAAFAQQGRAAGAKFKWPVPEDGTPGIPKMCAISLVDAAHLRELKQLGINHVIGGGAGPIPWTEDKLRSLIAAYKSHGQTLINIMIGGIEDVIRGGPKRDEQIEQVIQSIRAAGKAGLPVIEYNFYAHRIVEGYYEELGRGGAGMTAFQHSRVKDLPALEKEGVHTREQQFQRAAYFLKAVIPEAEKANVRLALHPNDPPAPLSRKSEQIMATFANWKRYLDLVKSPYNGMTYDCGVSRELGEDPLEVLKYLGARDCINHIHYRNVTVRKPYEDYAEVFLDNGQVDMFAIMKEIVRQKYNRGLYAEHPRAIDLDRRTPNGITGQYQNVGGGGFAGEIFNIGYARAMLQAALLSA